MIDIELLKSLSNVMQFKAREIIIEDGETMMDDMYIMIKGTADVYKNYSEPGEVKIAELKAGDFFGEMSLFLNKERTATVVASEDIVALKINRVNAYDFFEKQPEATYSLIKALCARLDNVNIAYKKLYTETHPETEPQFNPISPALSWIFPREHQSYKRIINASKISALNEKVYECPLCGHLSKAATVVQSGQESTYKVLRPARGMNDFYYDVITCPNCWYSAFAYIFNKPSGKGSTVFGPELSACKAELNGILENRQDINGIFAGYYLALKCASSLFTNHLEVLSRLWIRLSWLYYDCTDERLELLAAKHAKESLIAMLEKREVSADQIAHCQLAIGELSYKTADYKNAKQYLFLARDSGANIPELKKQADERLDDLQQRLHEMVNAMKAKSNQDKN